jgi:hypothetical protein
MQDITPTIVAANSLSVQAYQYQNTSLLRHTPSTHPRSSILLHAAYMHNRRPTIAEGALSRLCRAAYERPDPTSPHPHKGPQTIRTHVPHPTTQPPPIPTSSPILYATVVSRLLVELMRVVPVFIIVKAPVPAKEMQHVCAGQNTLHLNSDHAWVKLDCSVQRHHHISTAPASMDLHLHLYTRTVSVLDVPHLEARLPEQRCLLVPEDARDGHTVQRAAHTRAVHL